MAPMRFPALNDRAEGFDVPDERPHKAPRTASGQWVPSPEKLVPRSSGLDCGQWALPRRPSAGWALPIACEGQGWGMEAGDASLYGEGSVTLVTEV